MSKEKPMAEMPVMREDEGVFLFYPNVPEEAIAEVTKVLHSRWIGQGPRVAEFEKEFTARFGGDGQSLAVGSGTDALHLAYILAELKPGDEVITPVFTCTATTIPFLYMGVKFVFADIDPETLNISIPHVRQLVNEKTKAIVCVHYGGLPCDMNELMAIAAQYNIPVIDDAAHALGATYEGKPIGSICDFSMFSFQAIKHITTGDGGMLVVKDKSIIAKGERIRWFGIDRSNKQKGTWENDIWEVGYKYQMTDIAAAMGIAGLRIFDKTLAYRQKLFEIYKKNLRNVPGLKLIGADYTDRTHAAWLCTAIVENRVGFMNYLRENKIESGQIHYRNDRYSVLGGRRDDLPMMDSVEDKYIVLPLNNHLTEAQIEYVCATIKKGW
ncbi:MAG TPA: DegT/DnrJ/EryC1/StrS family aminotransferase [Cyclobacteriaceae bacterium]|nr:DegT/DnrJ/EryC1/StrS family aminotransferase [Cyclobacteriaceae bacterium]